MNDFNLDQFDILDIVPIPMKGDRMLRLRTLEEAIGDFSLTDDEVHGYFIQIRPKRAAAAPAPVAAASGTGAVAGSADGIYLSDGKLNVKQLSHSAELLFNSGEFALARNIYKAMIRAGNNTALAIFGIARCYESEGKLEEARINYEESIAYHPQTPAYKNLSSLLIRQNKNQEAAETIERALGLKDLTAESRFEFHKTAGNCWNRVGNFKEAERHYRKALEIQPKADEITVNLGVLNLQVGKLPEANRLFQDAVAANPKSHQALSGLGSCALALGDQVLALEFFGRALRIEIQNPTAIFHLVKCAYATKNYATATEILETYIQVAPVNANLMYSLAGLQFHVGKLTDAYQTCTRIQEIAPGHAGAIELSNRIAGAQGLSIGG